MSDKAKPFSKNYQKQWSETYKYKIFIRVNIVTLSLTSLNFLFLDGQNHLRWTDHLINFGQWATSIMTCLSET